MKFTKRDIKDQVTLERLIKEEATRIYESDSARHDRSYEQIYQAVSQGKVAEMYMAETDDYDFADLRWHDLKEKKKDGEYIEIKAYSQYSLSAGLLEKEVERIKKSTWNKSKYLIAFLVKDGEYTLYKKITLR
jgi:hypothetical protein